MIALPRREDAGPLALDEVVRELQHRVSGRVEASPARIRRWSRDFGRTAHATPAVVVEASGEADVSRVLALARAARIPVTVRGAGHSTNGRSLSDGGILLVTRAPREAAATLLPDGRAEIAGAGRWRDVERTLNRAGRRVPVLADYLDLSVGGTLSVGCYGFDSIAHGAQVDLVERLRLVLPDGTALWCSPTENAALFGASLAGLGRAGVIERAVIRTEPHRKVTALFSWAHEDLTAMVDSFGASTGDGPAMFKAVHARGRFVTTLGASFDTLREAAAAAWPSLPGARPRRKVVCTHHRFWRSLAVAAWVARFAGCRRVWCDYVLDLDGLRAFAGHLSRLLADPVFAGALASVYCLAIRATPRPTAFPLEAAGAIRAPLAFGIGLYCMVPRGDDGTLRHVERAMDGCLVRCVDLGGRPYLYGSHRLDRRTAERLYGDAAGIFQGGTLG